MWEGSEATGSALLVLLALADHYNPKEGFAWPSVDTIMNYARLKSPRTVQDNLRKLEELGEIKVVVGGGRKRPSRYYLNFKKFQVNKARKDQAEALAENPADFAGFDDPQPPETPQSSVAKTSETPQSNVGNPAIQRRQIAGEGIGNQEQKEERGTAPRRASLSLARCLERFHPAGVALGGMINAFPRASQFLSKIENDGLEENREFISEATETDWLALRVWVNEADDKARGEKLWPRNRSQFLQFAGEALEKVRTWWDCGGAEWWFQREAIAKRKKERLERQAAEAEAEPLPDFASPAEAAAFYESL